MTLLLLLAVSLLVNGWLARDWWGNHRETLALQHRVGELEGELRRRRRDARRRDIAPWSPPALPRPHIDATAHTAEHQAVGGTRGNHQNRVVDWNSPRVPAGPARVRAGGLREFVRWPGNPTTGGTS